jgi:hypothetical protein
MSQVQSTHFLSARFLSWLLPDRQCCSLKRHVAPPGLNLQASHAFAVSLADAGCIRHNNCFEEAGDGLTAIAYTKYRSFHDAVELAAAVTLGHLLFPHRG